MPLYMCKLKVCSTKLFNTLRLGVFNDESCQFAMNEVQRPPEKKTGDKPIRNNESHIFYLK